VSYNTDNSTPQLTADLASLVHTPRNTVTNNNRPESFG